MSNLQTKPKSKQNKKKNNPKHYVDNKKLYEDLKAYCIEYEKLNEGKGKDDVKVRPRMSSDLGRAIMLIAENTSTSPKFNGYSYRTEMVDDAVEACIKYLHNFDYKKYKNAFAYATQICWNAFIRRIKIENKEHYIKCKFMINAEVMHNLHDNHSSLEEFNAVTVELGMGPDSRVKMNEFIKDFEARSKKESKLRREKSLKNKALKDENLSEFTESESGK